MCVDRRRHSGVRGCSCGRGDLDHLARPRRVGRLPILGTVPRRRVIPCVTPVAALCDAWGGGESRACVCVGVGGRGGKEPERLKTRVVVPGKRPKGGGWVGGKKPVSVK